jgi:sulfur-oxidizing protein SoxY
MTITEEIKEMSSKETPTEISRRHVIVLVGAAAATAAMLPRVSLADKAATEAAIKKLGADGAKTGGITLDVPQIAENGNSVSVGLSVDSPMTEANYVKSVYLFADGNPNPEVCAIHFTPMSGAAKASTRIRLAKTQNVVAIAQMSDGSFQREAVEVKVTIGGCGG